MNAYINSIFTICLCLNIINLMLCRQAAQCPENEIYYNATLSPMCDVNCRNLQHRCPLTSFRPVAGCYCRPNYARNLQQRCIPRYRCAMDCSHNETPIAPSLRGCEQICRTSATGFRVSICYSRQQRNCVCSVQYCRNRRGQCVKKI